MILGLPVARILPISERSRRLSQSGMRSIKLAKLSMLTTIRLLNQLSRRWRSHLVLGTMIWMLIQLPMGQKVLALGRANNFIQDFQGSFSFTLGGAFTVLEGILVALMVCGTIPGLWPCAFRCL